MEKKRALVMMQQTAKIKTPKKATNLESQEAQIIADTIDSGLSIINARLIVNYHWKKYLTINHHQCCLSLHLKP